MSLECTKFFDATLNLLKMSGTDTGNPLAWLSAGTTQTQDLSRLLERQTQTLGPLDERQFIEHAV